MLWNIESFTQEKTRKNEKRRAQWLIEREWHSWFAWYPVRLISDTQKAWLCWLERRLDLHGRDKQPDWFFWDIRNFEYRVPHKDL